MEIWRWGALYKYSTFQKSSINAGRRHGYLYCFTTRKQVLRLRVGLHRILASKSWRLGKYIHSLYLSTWWRFCWETRQSILYTSSNFDTDPAALRKPIDSYNSPPFYNSYSSSPQPLMLPSTDTQTWRVPTPPRLKTGISHYWNQRANYPFPVVNPPTF